MITSTIFLDCLFHGRKHVSEHPDIGSVTPVSHCKNIGVCETNHFQFTTNNMSQQATQVSLEDLELCSLVTLNIKCKVYPTLQCLKHAIHM